VNVDQTLTAEGRAAAEAELAQHEARALELRLLLATDEWQRRRKQTYALNQHACSWCGARDSRPELDRHWEPTGRYICCGQGALGCPCRLARITGQTPEEFQAEALARQLSTLS
jgi:hypothetical protein